MTPPPMSVPAPEAAGDGGRRGKPKRRRFNFNVLENLEKMVQAKPAEPAPATGWTPPPAPAAPTPVQSSLPGLAPVTPAAVPSIVPEQPAGKGASTMGTPTPPAEPESQAPQDDSPSGPAEAETQTAVEPEHIEEPEPPAKRQSRSSMRSMMFGEEPLAPTSPSQPAGEESSKEESAGAGTTPSAEPPATEAGSAWPSYPWQKRDEASSSGSEEGPSADAEPQDSVQATNESEGATGAASDGSDPWRSTTSLEPDAWTTTREPEPQPVGTGPVDEAQPPTIEASESVSPAAPESTVPDGDRPSAGTLVIIEDDQTAATYYSTLFRGNGYQVEVANDGVSGVDLCVRVQPQVILLDVMMPRQNGILVLQTLRASDETKNTPVVVMSNFSEPTLIKRALQLGALEYVIKTQVEGPALLNALPRWMNREKAFAA
jgi:CheY-like chemotaxis protein